MAPAEVRNSMNSQLLALPEHLLTSEDGFSMTIVVILGVQVEMELHQGIYALQIIQTGNASPQEA